MATLAVSTNTLTKTNEANKKIYEIISSKTNSTANQKLHGIIYGVIDIEEFSSYLLPKFRTALVSKVLASKYVKFYIRPQKRKNGKAIITLQHTVPTLWACYYDRSVMDRVDEYIHKHGYSKKVERAKISTHRKLLESNAKRCLSFSIHVDDLIAIDEYIRSIFKDYALSAKTEIYIEFDIDNKKMSINKEFEVKILKIKTCEDKK